MTDPKKPPPGASSAPISSTTTQHHFFQPRLSINSSHLNYRFPNAFPTDFSFQDITDLVYDPVNEYIDVDLTE